MRVAGLVMIAIGLLGLGLSLIDLETIDAFQAEETVASISEEKTATDAATIAKVAADHRTATRTLPNEQAKVGTAEGERPAMASKHDALAASESSKANAVTERSPASVKIFEREDGTEPSAPTLWADIAAGSETVSEDSVHAKFLLTLSEPSDRSVVIIFSTIDLSATDQEDYRSQRGTVTFEPGVVSAEIRTSLVDDDIEEKDEQFAIVLNGAPNTVNFRNRRAAVTIKDDD